MDVTTTSPLDARKVRVRRGQNGFPLVTINCSDTTDPEFQSKKFVRRQKYNEALVYITNELTSLILTKGIFGEEELGSDIIPSGIRKTINLFSKGY